MTPGTPELCFLMLAVLPVCGITMTVGPELHLAGITSGTTLGFDQLYVVSAAKDLKRRRRIQHVFEAAGWRAHFIEAVTSDSARVQQKQVEGSTATRKEIAIWQSHAGASSF